ncbi:MAG: hypothetical protein LUF82_01990 [Clostridia bacterium]|nr:hypothetical protein [Clostridia bacterium]
MKKLNKGFTVAEGAVALAVTTIISAAITVLCIYSAKKSPEVYAEFRAYNIAADVVTCFKSACEDGGQSALEDNLSFYSGQSVENTAGSADGYLYYEFNCGNVSVCTYAYLEEKKVTVNLYYASSGGLLYSYTYTAGEEL